MAIYASTSWIMYAGMRCNSILAFITSSIVRATLRQLSPSLNRKDFWSQQIFVTIELSFVPTSRAVFMIDRKDSFAGVVLEGNCNESQISDNVTKKNTQITSLSVSNAVCTKRNTIGDVINPNVAHRKNRRNIFVRCYV